MARKLKHKKLRNTGLLYELLIRQLTTDVLNNNNPLSVDIIKRYFGKNSPLKEELYLYETLLNQKVKDSSFALKIVEATIATKNSIDKESLDSLKYKLISDISKNIKSEAFFKTKVDNYPVYASICNLFEYDEKENPAEFLKNKITVAEFLLDQPGNAIQEEKRLLKDIDSELGPLAFALATKKFNEKYENLGDRQKDLLRHFILNSIRGGDTKEYILKNIKEIRSNLTNTLLRGRIAQITAIKVKEVLGLLEKIEKASIIKESHYMSLMRYYELIDELKKEEA